MTKLFRRLTITLVAALVTSLGAVVAQPAYAGAPAVTRLQAAAGSITNSYDGRCLDVNLGGGTFNGQKVQVWDCNGWNNQRWTYYADNTIRSWYDGRCLDLNLGGGTFNGQKVQVWDCTGGANQRWTILLSGLIISQYDGRCLDLNLGGGTFNGQKVQVWDCNGWANQHWETW